MSKEQELNEYLAEEIMGWEFRTPDWAEPDPEEDYPGSDYKCWHNPEAENLEELNITNEKYLYPDGSNTLWNPLTNLEQAFEVLEEYCEGYDLNHSNEYYTIEIYGQFVNMFAGRKILSDYTARTKPKAIIGAILKVESKFEEFKEVFE